MGKLKTLSFNLPHSLFSKRDVNILASFKILNKTGLMNFEQRPKDEKNNSIQVPIQIEGIQCN